MVVVVVVVVVMNRISFLGNKQRFYDAEESGYTYNLSSIAKTRGMHWKKWGGF